MRADERCSFDVLWLMPPSTGCRVVGGVAGAVVLVGLLRGLARFATQAAGPGGVTGGVRGWCCRFLLSLVGASVVVC